MTIATETTLIHVRFEGRSEDLDTAMLRLAPDASDAALRTALAKRYDRAPADFDGYLIVREPQAIIVRPVAFYG